MAKSIARGPWNDNAEITFLESPALEGFQVLKATPKAARTTFDDG